MGNDKFTEYFKTLVLIKTGIDLPFEAAPLVDNLNSSRDIEHATASYGQGYCYDSNFYYSRSFYPANGGKFY